MGFFFLYGYGAPLGGAPLLLKRPLPRLIRLYAASFPITSSVSKYHVIVSMFSVRSFYVFIKLKTDPAFTSFLYTGGKFIRYRRKVCRVRTRRRYFIRINKRRRPIRNVFRRIGVFIRRKYRKVVIRRRVWRARIKRRLRRIKRRGRFWYYLVRGKWRRLRKPRFVIRIKRKRRTLRRSRYGWTFKYRKKRRRLVRRVKRFIRVRGRRIPVRRRGKRRYSIKKRRGGWTRARKVRRYRRRRKYNFSSLWPLKQRWTGFLMTYENKSSVSLTVRTKYCAVLLIRDGMESKKLTTYILILS